MWNQSENARLQQELQNSDLTGQALLRKFHTGPRESLRLAAALRGIFTVGSAGEAEKREYWAYLARRPIPAATALIEDNRIGDLRALFEELPLTAGVLETLLQTARTLRRPEAVVWLLERKAELGLFQDRDFSL